jgi:hypothetical protein
MSALESSTTSKDGGRTRVPSTAVVTKEGGGGSGPPLAASGSSSSALAPGTGASLSRATGPLSKSDSLSQINASGSPRVAAAAATPPVGGPTSLIQRIGRELNAGWAIGTPPSPFVIPRNASNGGGAGGVGLDKGGANSNWSASLLPPLGLPPQRIDTDDDLLHKQVRCPLVPIPRMSPATSPPTCSDPPSRP